MIDQSATNLFALELLRKYPEWIIKTHLSRCYYAQAYERNWCEVAQHGGFDRRIESVPRERARVLALLVAKATNLEHLITVTYKDEGIMFSVDHPYPSHVRFLDHSLGTSGRTTFIDNPITGSEFGFKMKFSGW